MFLFYYIEGIFMKRNIFSVIFSYIFIGIIFTFSVFPVYNYFSNISEFHSFKLNTIYFILVIMHLIVITFLYFLAGYLFFKPQKSKKKNLISVWWLSIALVITAILSSYFKTSLIIGSIYYMSNPLAYILNGLNSLLRLTYSMKTQMIFWLNICVYATILFTSLIPSAGIWFGMLIKSKQTSEKAILLNLENRKI